MTELESLREKNDLNILWDYIPGLSFYQITFVFMVSIYQLAAGSLQVAQIILQVAPDNITCVESGHVGCNTNCTEYDYHFALFNETVISEFGLVCEKDNYSSFISSISLFGLFFGAISTGFASDRYGRKTIILIGTTGCALCSLCTSIFSYNIYLYTIFRMITGALVHGTGCVSLTWLMEFVAIKYRSWVAAISYFFFDVGIANLSLVLLFVHYMMISILIL